MSNKNNLDNKPLVSGRLKNRLSWALSRDFGAGFAKQLLSEWKRLLPIDFVAALQAADTVENHRANTATAFLKSIEEAAADGTLPSSTTTLGKFYGDEYPCSIANVKLNSTIRLVPTKRPDTACIVIDAADFLSWLTSQGETPTEHIRAWVAATVAAALPPEVNVTQSAIQRQDARLARCRARGLVFTHSLGRLPNGITRAAEEEWGISRQSLSKDLTAALEREEEAAKEGSQRQTRT